MPATALFESNTALIGSRSNAYCPAITDLSINSTIFQNTPLVFGIQSLQDCSRNMFVSDPYLVNTNGCCVLDTSAQTCAGMSGIEVDENTYYMGVRYYDDTTSEGREKGERKLCYTAPIARKKLDITALAIKITTEVATLIAIAIVAACYEYWFTYGECSLRHIVTNLGDLPYNVGDDNSLTSKTMQVTRISKCEEEITSSITESEVWYETFPYNLITYFNKPGLTDDDDDYDDAGVSKKKFRPQELGNMLIRSFLLGFFYCIIFTRVFIKCILKVIESFSSEVYDGKPSKFKEVISGFIFVFVFMGIWGNIYTKYADNNQFLGGACLYLLMFLMMFLWIPGLLSYVFLMLTFMGYRRGTYTKYGLGKAKANAGTEGNIERFYNFFDCYNIVNTILGAKMWMTKEKDNSSIVDENNQIINEKILDWFYPIRRSDLTLDFKLFDFFNYAVIEQTKGYTKTETEWGLFAWLRSLNQCTSPYTWAYIRDWLGEKKTIQEMNDEYDKMSFPLTLLYGFISFFLMFWLKIAIQLAYIVVRFFGCVFIHAMWITILINFIMYFAMPAGLFGSLIAFFYLNLYIMIGFFYVPFKNYTSLFKIIKSHGNILTLLFCIVVIINSVQHLRSESAGVVGGLLALIILYKIITTLSN